MIVICDTAACIALHWVVVYILNIAYWTGIECGGGGSINISIISLALSVVCANIYIIILSAFSVRTNPALGDLKVEIYQYITRLDF